jgi:ribosomal protein S27AE
MVTVIKDNVPRYKVTCETCGSILGFGGEDILWTQHIDEIDGWHTYKLLKGNCPCCGEVVILAKDDRKWYEKING